MAITSLKALASQEYLGTLKFSILQVDLGAYATNGVIFPKEAAGIGNILGVIPIAGRGGYVYDYIPSTGKLKIYRAAGITPAGTIAVTDGAVTVTGGALGEAIGINPDTNAGVLSKAAATNRTIPQATFGIAATTAAFTGTAVAAGALTEVANGVDLGSVDPTFLIIGV